MPEKVEDLGQSQVQAKKDIEEALGYVPSDGASLGGDKDLDPEELAAHQAEANKQFMNPAAGGQAAEKPEQPHAADSSVKKSKKSAPES